MFSRLAKSMNVFLRGTPAADVFNDSAGVFKNQVLRYIAAL